LHCVLTCCSALQGLPPRQQQQQQQQQGAREVCPQCGLSFATLSELIQHAEAAHNNSSNASNAASAGYQQQQQQQQQQQRGGSVEEFACPSCSRRFSDAALLVSHSEQCNKAAAATCVLC
jgi:DNA-directed RNA polymerase subunit M/transcription elongation factor TFIIS